jgi:hypothetical protein
MLACLKFDETQQQCAIWIEAELWRDQTPQDPNGQIFGLKLTGTVEV